MNKKELLLSLYNTNKDCKRCALSSTRKNFVFGEGDPDSRIMFIGEAPGRVEDETGHPFVGRAGELLTAIIEKGLKIPRERVYIANILKCRPTIDGAGQRDRPPEKGEVDCCSHILESQIDIIKPEVIITLGNPSTKFILRTDIGITKMRGKMYDRNGIKVVPTYHPSYILRNGGDKSPLKKDVWEDIKLVIKYLGLNIDET